MDAWTNKWMHDEWMDEWRNERMNEWMNEWTNQRMNERTNQRMNECMNEQMHEQSKECLNKRMDAWTNLASWIASSSQKFMRRTDTTSVQMRCGSKKTACYNRNMFLPREISYFVFSQVFITFDQLCQFYYISTFSYILLPKSTYQIPSRIRVWF